MSMPAGSGPVGCAPRPADHRVAVTAGVLSLVLTATAVACVGCLHLLEGLSPTRTVISDYVFTGLGAVLLPIGMLAFAGAMAFVTRGLIAERLAGLRIAALLGAASVGLSLMACFRGDPTGAPTTVAGLVHKLAGGLLFAAVPAAGWLLSRRLPPGALPLASSLKRLAVFDAAAFTVFLATYLPGLGSVPGGRTLAGFQGLAERVTLVPDVVLVGLVAGWLATRTGGTAQVAPVPVAAGATHPPEAVSA